MHLAGFKYAGVSVQRPLHTYQQNVTGTATLLAAMEAQGVDRIVFSSSAAVYGTPDVDLVTEATPKHPESPYGESKLIGEWLLRRPGARRRAARTRACATSTSSARARPEVFDASPHNLFPLVFDALLDGRTPRINGADYPTPDGTCVRDYIHVADLADAHVAAARRLDAGEPDRARLQPRLGRRRLGRRDHARGAPRSPASRSTPRSRPRRAGDPAASSRRANSPPATSTGAMRHTLAEMVASAWQARRAAPRDRGAASAGRCHNVRHASGVSARREASMARLRVYDSAT